MKSLPSVFRWSPLVCASLLGLAALCAPADALAVGRPVGQATAAEKSKAQQAYLSALAHYKAKRFDQALEGFRASYDVVASPNSHIMVVNVLVDMHRDVEAYDEAVAVVAEADLLGEAYADAAKAAREAMATLIPRLGFVTFRVVQGATLISLSAGKRALPVGHLETPVAVAPGQVEVTWDVGRGPESKLVDVAAGSNLGIEVGAAPPKAVAPPVAAKPPEPRDPLRTAGFVSAGVGVVGLVGFAVFGSMSNSKFSTLEEECPNHECPPSAKSDRDAGQTFQTTANLMLVVGVVGAAAGAGLLTWSYTGHGKSDKPTTALQVGVGPGSIDVRGRF